MKGSRRHADRVLARELMRAERREIRELTAALTPTQWQRRSLCAGWTVRDVVAHLVGWDDLLLYRTGREHAQALAHFSAQYARSFASMRRLNDRITAPSRPESAEARIQQFAAADDADLKWLFDGSNPNAHLAEYVIHHQDIRVALDMPRRIPQDRLAAALDGVTQLPGVRLGARRRLLQHRWTATDVDWSRGRGPVRRARGETILMELAGRN